MDSLAQNYAQESSSDSDAETNSSAVTAVSSVTTGVSLVNSAPDVVLPYSKKHRHLDPTATEIWHNPKFEDLSAPVQGPLPEGQVSHPTFVPKPTTLAGHVEVDHVDGVSFREQYYTYQSRGFARDPSRGIHAGYGRAYVGDVDSLRKHKGCSVFNERSKTSRKRKRKECEDGRRMKAGDPSDVGGYLGPWAPIVESAEEEQRRTQELAERKKEWDLLHPKTVIADANEDDANDSDNDRNGSRKRIKLSEDGSANDSSSLADPSDPVPMSEELRKRMKRADEQKSLESSTFHGESLTDWQGRSYLYCPPHRRAGQVATEAVFGGLSELGGIGESSKRDEGLPGVPKYYIPKRCIHTLSGHRSGVNSLQWFPRSGHLLLSASNDKTIKLWDTYGDFCSSSSDSSSDKNKSPKCIRTYQGHSAGVRNIQFTKDGRKFLSCGYDTWLKMWDTEKGKVIWRGSSKKLCFDPKLYPLNDEHEFVVGQKNKVAVQWDLRSNSIVCRYEEHLQSVNAVLFIDNSRRLITTSDDKSIFYWDYGTPVVIKHVSNPGLHSVPFVTLHANRKHFLGQSMDNQIVVYGASQSSKFKAAPKKHLKGHLSSGYACQLDVSPDGRFVMSGDARGLLYFWDWKTKRVFSKLKAHSQVALGCVWHPVLTSRVASCSWDGTIKFWD